MTKVVINRCFGGFGLSKKGYARYFELGGKEDYEGDIKRDDPALVQAVGELGGEANNDHSKLKIVEIPDDVEWYIYNHDGIETVREKHRIWS